MVKDILNRKILDVGISAIDISTNSYYFHIMIFTMETIFIKRKAKTSISAAFYHISVFKLAIISYITTFASEKSKKAKDLLMKNVLIV